MKAALLEKAATDPILVEDVECASPRAGEVKIDVTHCGICHSDLTLFEAPVAPAPMVLGHEAAGVVVEVGPGVTSLSIGDSVMLSPFAPCGRCYFCVRGDTVLCPDAASMFTGVLADGTSPLSRNGEMVYRGLGVGGFGAETVVGESAAVKIPPDVPRNVAAVMGCAVQTGVGAVLNTAKMEPGATCMVMGLGGVGMSVVQGAKIAGASQVIVSDPIKERRKLAMSLGATEAIDPKEVDVVGYVKDITGGIGVDYAFDAVGSSDLVAKSFDAVRNGGTVVMVGAPPMEDDLKIPGLINFMITEKKIMGSLYGSSDSRREVPRLLELWKAGRLDLEAMISKSRPIEDIHKGLKDMREGHGVRTILEF